MFVPLYDNNFLRHIGFQYVTVLLVAANVAVFLLQQSGLPLNAVISFALVPNEIAQGGFLGQPVPGPNDLFAVPEQYTLVSYMFFHADWVHLLGNMLFLWVFGDNVEDAMGHVKYLLFYLLCGIAAGVAHAIVMVDSPRPLIGASGAVAGVVAAYLMLHPRVRVWVLAMKVIPLQINAALALGLWIAMQVAMVLVPQVGPVAWWAHIGGLVAGAVLVLILRKPGVPLFDKNLPRSPPA